MELTRESGHVLAGLVTGGHIERVYFSFIDFSRTDLSANPHPMIVAFAGPIWGAILPVLIWLALRAAHFRYAFIARFFAGFCLIANGAYLASAIVIPAGDTADLLRMGAPIWALVVPGVIILAAGLALWNGLWPVFGVRCIHAAAQ